MSPKRQSSEDFGTLHHNKDVFLVANVRLSEDELQIVLNSDFILQKNKIIQDLIAYFQALGKEFQARLRETEFCRQNAIPLSNHKVSKGENYLGLPYIMLDIPRIFGKDDILAIRCFFWWGHFISISLLLKGDWQQKFEERIRKNLSNDHWQIDTSESPWNHDNKICQPLQMTSKISKDFFKISKQINISDWDCTSNFLEKNFDTLLFAMENSVY